MLDSESPRFNTSPATWGFFFASAKLRHQSSVLDDVNKSNELHHANRVAERLKGRHGGARSTEQGGNISTLNDQGKSRDIAAAKAGLGPPAKTVPALAAASLHSKPCTRIKAVRVA